MSMFKKLKGIDLTKSYDKRALVITHFDLDGVVAAYITKVALAADGIDTQIMWDYSSNAEVTSEMCDFAYSGLKTCGMEFSEIYVLDRSLNHLNVPGHVKVVHIDHHISGYGDSLRATGNNSNITNYYGYRENKFAFSAAMLTYEYFLRTHNKWTLSTNVNRIAMLAMLTDLWDTFVFTQTSTLTTEEYSQFLRKRYNSLLGCSKASTLEDIVKPQMSPISLQFIFSYLGTNAFFNILDDFDPTCKESIDRYDVVISKSWDDLNKAKSFLDYAYKDALNNSSTYGEYKSSISKMVANKIDSDEKVICDVLFVDRPIQFNVVSLAAAQWLDDHQDVILVMKTSAITSTYSVRSHKSIDSLELATRLGGGGHASACGFELKELTAKKASITEEFRKITVAAISNACGDTADKLISMQIK